MSERADTRYAPIEWAINFQNMIRLFVVHVAIEVTVSVIRTNWYQFTHPGILSGRHHARHPEKDLIGGIFGMLARIFHHPNRIIAGLVQVVTKFSFA